MNMILSEIRMVASLLKIKIMFIRTPILFILYL